MWRAVTVLECASRKRGFLVHSFLLDRLIFREAPAPADTASPATGSKPASSAADAPAEPSPEVLKEAKREGFKVKKRDGVTKYCNTDATLGTHFVTEKCYSEQDMLREVQRRQDQRNLLRQQGACSGANCSGH